MKKRRISRRRFLRGMGSVAVALPLLSHGLPAFTRKSYANQGMSQAFPKRFIFMIHPNGTIEDAWFPKNVTSDTAFDLAEIHAPLATFKDKINLFKGVHLSSGSTGPGEPHQKGMGGILTGRPLQEGKFRGGDGSLAGWGDGISVDQYIAKYIGKDTSFESLELGVRADNSAGSEVRSRIAYSGAGQPLPPINDPVDVFDQLFKDAMTDDETLDQIRKRRASVLDGVKSQFKAVHRYAGQEDKLKLDRHLGMVRDL